MKRVKGGRVQSDNHTEHYHNYCCCIGNDADEVSSVYHFSGRKNAAGFHRLFGNGFATCGHWIAGDIFPEGCIFYIVSWIP